MNAKNFVNFHVLISHSPSCLNRDDMNMQKTAIFGGKTRVRISSQSLKRAMRKSDYYAAHFGFPSIRTRELEKLIPHYVEALKNEFVPDIVAKTMELFVRAKVLGEEADDSEPDESTEPAQTKKLAVAPWVLAEIRTLCKIVGDIVLNDDELVKSKDLFIKQKGKKKRPELNFIDAALTKKRMKAIEENISSLRQAIGTALDIALSGRMATSGLMTSVDGALAVAHALTTHAVEPQDVDWFTAVDDLSQDEGGTGAGHLNTQQFSAGVFYRYASLNLRQLQVNLGLIEMMTSEETSESRQRALNVARHVLHMMATVIPTAKQQSFAAHNMAELALVSFGDQPISLANTFEKPVRIEPSGGYLAPSQQALVDYWQRMNMAYELDESAAIFHLGGSQIPSELTLLETLPKLEKWVESGGAGV